MDLKQKLEARAASLGVSAKRSLGQNFLVSENVVGKIISKVTEFSTSSSRWVEIGPGLGSLTDRLLETRGERTLQLIELDRELADFWRKSCAENPGLSVEEADALQFDWSKLDADILVSNLPYQIAASLVVELSTCPNSIQKMVLMFQKEVAQRIRARPKTEDYGLLSVVAQVFWKAEMVCEAGPRDFSPAPRVASRVLSFERKASPVPGEEQKFLKFVKAAWAQRRKKLITNLGSYVSKDILRDQWPKLGLSETARAEELDPSAYLPLYLALK